MSRHKTKTVRARLGIAPKGSYPSGGASLRDRMGLLRYVSLARPRNQCRGKRSEFVCDSASDVGDIVSCI